MLFYSRKARTGRRLCDLQDSHNLKRKHGPSEDANLNPKNTAVWLKK